MRLKPGFLLLFLVVVLKFSMAQVTVQSFEGIDASTASGNVRCCVVDPNGAVGTKQYLEWVDTAYQAYDKTTFAPIYTTPKAGDSPWVLSGEVNCQGTDGNGVVMFDHLASRWLIAVRQGSISTGNYYFCIAVSNTDDLTSTTFKWYSYAQLISAVLGKNAKGHTYFPDYPKIASWIDAYYVTIDIEDPDLGFQNVGVLTCAFDRASMILGHLQPRAPQCFRYLPSPTGVFLGHSLLPADIDGTVAPPTGTPEAFVSIENPSTGSTSTTLNFWELKLNWITPSLSTFTGPTAVTVPTYTPGCYDVTDPTATACVPEPSSATTKVFIDSLGDRLMHRFAYRAFSTAPTQTYVVSQTVQVGSGSLSQTGIAWYQFRVGGVLVNSGIITSTDGNYRFVPSAAQDKMGNMAVGYSVSGTSLSPSIRAAYLNVRSKGVLTPTEFNILTGTADEENTYRWGGYTSMTVDPVDDCTFWYVNEYFTTPQSGPMLTWQTRISNFQIPGC